MILGGLDLTVSENWSNKIFKYPSTPMNSLKIDLVSVCLVISEQYQVNTNKCLGSVHSVRSKSLCKRRKDLSGEECSTP